jgi:hypothetical protein
MRALADHYRRMRLANPDDELCVVFDIDGTILVGYRSQPVYPPRRICRSIESSSLSWSSHARRASFMNGSLMRTGAG